MVGYLAQGERDQVTSTFDDALRGQYVRELRAYAEAMTDRQPEGGPRM